MFAIWCVACAYSVGFCFQLGVYRDASTLTYVFGFPDWIFWGVVLPWTVCTVLSFIITYFVMRDDDLGEEQSEEQFVASTENSRA